MNDQAKLPLLSVPAEILEAAKAHKHAMNAIAEAADKWGNLADAVTSWNIPAAFVIGVLIGFALLAIFKK